MLLKIRIHTKNLRKSPRIQHNRFAQEIRSRNHIMKRPLASSQQYALWLVFRFFRSDKIFVTSDKISSKIQNRHPNFFLSKPEINGTFTYPTYFSDGHRKEIKFWNFFIIEIWGPKSPSFVRTNSFMELANLHESQTTLSSNSSMLSWKSVVLTWKPSMLSCK